MKHIYSSKGKKKTSEEFDKRPNYSTDLKPTDISNLQISEDKLYSFKKIENIRKKISLKLNQSENKTL